MIVMQMRGDTERYPVSLNVTRKVPKKILMLLQSDYPSDIRVQKEIRALTGCGYRLYLLCNNGTLRPAEESLDGATVRRLAALKWLPAGIRKALRLPLFFNPVWIFYLWYAVRKYRVDCLHVHDLPLVLSAIWVGKLNKLPVVYDMHENYPAAMEVWYRRDLQHLVLKNYRLARTLDRFCLSRVERIIVVVDEQKDNLIAQGIPADKITVVGNTVDVDTFFSFQLDSTVIQRYRDNFVILYVGSFAVDRGLETPIHAMTLLREKLPAVKLLYVGDGKNRKALEKSVVERGLEDCVEFVGWVNFELVSSYVHASRVCIIPQPSNPANDTTIPHKLFQYMAVGKPVVTSDAKPIERVVRECGCGLSFKSTSFRDFADTIVKISGKENEFGTNGQRAVREKYNWKATSKALLGLYKGVWQSVENDKQQERL